MLIGYKSVAYKVNSLDLGPHTQNSLTYVDLSAKSSTFVSWA